jgi:hypothetical protein
MGADHATNGTTRFLNARTVLVQGTPFAYIGDGERAGYAR